MDSRDAVRRFKAAKGYGDNNNASDGGFNLLSWGGAAFVCFLAFLVLGFAASWTGRLPARLDGMAINSLFAAALIIGDKAGFDMIWWKIRNAAAASRGEDWSSLVRTGYNWAPVRLVIFGIGAMTLVGSIPGVFSGRFGFAAWASIGLVALRAVTTWTEQGRKISKTLTKIRSKMSVDETLDAYGISEGDDEADTSAKPLTFTQQVGFKVEIGQGAGVLLGRNHAAGIGNNQPVVLYTRDMCEHLLIEGRSGGGKTLAGILRIMRQTFRARASGSFLISSKRNFTRQLKFLAERFGHPVWIISPDEGVQYNIGHGLSPNAWGNFIMQAFDLNAGNKGTDAFFSPNSTMRVINAAKILSGSSVDGYTTPKALYDYIFTPAAERHARDQDHENIATMLEASDDPAERQRGGWIRDALAYERGPLAEIEKADKTIAGVLGQIATVLEPLATVEMHRAFGSESGVRLDAVLDGAVLILDIDKKKYGAQARSLIQLAMFEQFYGFLEDRLKYPASDPRRSIPVSFVVDEWRDCISGAQIEFFQKARESNCAGIMAIQGDGVMLSGLKGDKAMRDSLVGLFSQTLTFPVNDDDTKSRIVRKIGKAEIVKFSANTSTGTSENRGSSSQMMAAGGSTNRGSGTTESLAESVSTSLEDVVLGSTFAGLERRAKKDAQGREVVDPHTGDPVPEWFQAIFTGFSRGNQLDDVVWIHVDDDLLKIASM